MADAGPPAEGWLLLSEGLIGGIHHALNNRMAALGGAVQVLEADLAAGHPLVGAMSGELRRLETTASLLRLLVAGEGGFEAVQVDDVIGDSQRLFEVHHTLRDLRLNLTSQADLLPLWTHPSELLRALLLMMAAVGTRGPARGGEVAVTVTGDAVLVRITVSVAECGGEDETDEDGMSPEILARDVASMVARLGGELEAMEVDEGARWTLSLPTLPEARRREKDGV